MKRNKKIFIGFLMGVLVCLLMIMPSASQASVIIDGSYGSINLDNWNESSSDPDVKTATVTTNGDVSSSFIGLWGRTPGWSIINNGDIYSNNFGGIALVDTIDGHLVFWNGDVTNNGEISGRTYGVHLNSGTVTNNFLIESGPGYPLLGVGGMGVYFYGSEGVLSDATLINNNTGTINGFYAGAGFNSLSGGGNVTVTNDGTINAWGGSGDWNSGGYGGDGSGDYWGYGGSGYSGDWNYDDYGDWTETWTYGGDGGDGGYGGGYGTNDAYGGSGGYGGDAWGGYGAGVYIANIVTATVTNSYEINGWGGDAYGGAGGDGGYGSSGGYGGTYTYGGDGGSGGDAYGGDGAGVYMGMPMDFNRGYLDDDDDYTNFISIATAEVTNNAGGTINAWGGDAYGGAGGDGGNAHDGTNVYGGSGGAGGSAYGGDGAGIYIDGSYPAWVGDDDDDFWSITPGTGTATVTNSGTIKGWGGDAYGGQGGAGGWAYNSSASEAYGGQGGSGGGAYGGDGTGVAIVSVGTATVTNDVMGTINGYGGYAYGGQGGSGGNGESPGYGWISYGGNGGSGGNAYGGDGYGIFVGDTMMTKITVRRDVDDDDDAVASSMTAAIENSGKINGYGGYAWGGFGGSGGSGYGYDLMGGYGVGGDGGDGGYAYGGDGYGIEAYNLAELAITNNAGGEINGWGGEASGGDGGDGGTGYTDSDTTPVTTYGSSGWGGSGYGGDGYGIKINEVALATIDNSGLINGYGGDGFSGDGQGGEGTGIFIADAGTVTITNNAGGEINGYRGNNEFDDDDDDFIKGFSVDDDDDMMGSNGISARDAVSLTVDNSGKIFGDHNGIIAFGTTDMTATVINNAGGEINGVLENGLAFFDVGTVVVDNAGIIKTGELVEVPDDDDDMIGMGGREGILINGSAFAGTTSATVINREGGLIEGHGGMEGLAVYMNSYEYVPDDDDDFDDDDDWVGRPTTVDVLNAGTVTGDNAGVSIFGDDLTTATVINDATGIIRGFDDGLNIFNAGTVSVTNNAGGEINGGMNNGLAIFDAGTVTVDNAGTIKSGMPVPMDDDDDMIGMGGREGILINGSMSGATTSVSVTNREGGLMEGHGGEQYSEGLAVYVNSYPNDDDDDFERVLDDDDDFATTVDVFNAGMITGDSAGVGIWGDDLTKATVINDATGTIRGMDNGLRILGPGSVDVTNLEGGSILSVWGDGIYVDGSYVAQGDWYSPGTGTVKVTNSGAIISYDEYDESYYDDGIHISNVGSAEVINNATGEITGYNGIYMSYIGSPATAKVTNYGMITGYGSTGAGVYFYDVLNGEITNYEGGVISGYSGVWADGNTKIDNYGTITGDGGVAIDLYGGDNQVIMRTGSEFNGDIVADGSYSNNLIFDGMGETPADQIRGFDTMEKTGAGTWILTGDQNYNTYATTALRVTDGILALNNRSGNGGGITVASYVQTGGSLGYVVTDTSLVTGELNVTGNANFNDGTVVVIPTPAPPTGIYHLQTIYPNVLTAGTITNMWTDVTANSVYLDPDLVRDTTYTLGERYDLVLNRLSFTTGAGEGNTGLGEAFDAMYDDPAVTGDLRNLLNELLLLTSEGEAERAFAQLGGGSHTAFQFMSFNGLGKYLGVLNNHMGGGSGFARNMGTTRSWYANDDYQRGVHLAMAGGGNSMSDAAPILLAMAGDFTGQSVASGTNWGLWVDGYASVGNRRSNEIISKYKQTLYGGMMGFDIRAADNLYLGISAGMSTSDLKFDALMDNGKMDSYHGSFYVCYDGKPWYATGVLTYADNKYNLERYTYDSQWAKSDYSGDEFVGYVEVGYKLDAGAVLIRPLAAFQADYLTQEAFTETGASLYNLSIDKRDTGSYQSFLGVNVSSAIKLGNSASLTPELRVKWAHEFSNDGQMINARFAGMGPGSWTVESEQLNRDTAIVGAGLNLMFNKNVAAYVQYDAELNSDFINHTGLIGLRFAW